ncbi:MAG: transporter substrate-binding domain-containing protein [Yoonia sp.]|nr:transporter substrate-binding domain-containing protein [Yoonia sp.]
MDATLNTLARDGVLRVAINTGNRALVQIVDGVPQGVSPALARRLADQIGAKMDVVLYDGAGKVFNDATADIWDIAFLAIDATRAKGISFTRSYFTIEATYAVRKGGPVRSIEQADQDGLTVLTSIGSAYDMYLGANLKHANHDRTGTPTESFAAFQQGRGDVVAGVRASLLRFFQDDPTIEVLSGVVTEVAQAMVLPGADNPVIDALDAFVAEAIGDGFVEAHTA